MKYKPFNIYCPFSNTSYIRTNRVGGLFLFCFFKDLTHVIVETDQFEICSTAQHTKDSRKS